MPRYFDKRFSVPACICLISISLSGCGDVGYQVNSVFSVSKIPNDLYEEDGTVKVDSPRFITLYTDANNISDQPKSTMARNEILSAIMLSSNTICDAHLALILQNQALTNFNLGLATNVFAGLATVMTVDSTKTIYSALSGLTNSTRSLANEEIWLDTLAIAINRAIELKREEELKPLQVGLAKTTREYTIDQGLIDVARYHNSCSFRSGVQEISKSLENRPITTDDINERIFIVRGQIDDDRSFLKENSSALASYSQQTITAIQERLAGNEQRLTQLQNARTTIEQPAQ